MKFNIFTTTVALALISAPAAWSGSLVETQPEPIIVPMATVAPAPYDWSGFYAGLSAGKSSGDFTYLPAPDTYDLDGRSLGGFAGYNWQRGSLVYGLELALQDVDAELEGFPTYHYNYMHDLKARIGFANDNILFYAFGGLSKGEWENDTDGTFDADGTNMGLGVEMAFWGNWLAGLEYIRRSVDGDFGTVFPGESFDSDLDTVQLRVGYKF